jgi:hypothetical protein
MKFFLLLNFALFALTIAFAPPSLATRTLTSRFADPKDEKEEGGLDLDLSEMFDL